MEHFSICSDDSIWQDDGTAQIYDSESEKQYEQEQYDLKFGIETVQNNPPDHCYTIETDSKNITFINNNNISNNQPQCYIINSTTENEFETNPFSQSANKYKSHIMEKYLRDCQKPENIVPNSDDCNNYDEMSKPSMFSKWRESAAKFRPSEKNYLHWTLLKTQKKKNKKQVCNNNDVNYQQHGREELDAAETLTRLANAHSSFPLKIQ